MNRTSLSFRATRRTRSSSLSALCPALGPERVSLAAFPLAGRLPSTTSAAPPWALFGSFTGSTRPSDCSRSSITGLRPRPSPHDPPYHHHRRVTVRPPDSQHGEIARMLRFSDPAGSTSGSRKRRRSVAFRRLRPRRHPSRTQFRGSIAWPACTPVNASLRPRGSIAVGTGLRSCGLGQPPARIPACACRDRS